MIIGCNPIELEITFKDTKKQKINLFGFRDEDIMQIKDILREIKSNIQTEMLYRQEFINYSGETLDTKKKYSEILAEKLYNNEIKINITSTNTPEKETSGSLHKKDDIKYSIKYGIL